MAPFPVWMTCSTIARAAFVSADAAGSTRSPRLHWDGGGGIVAYYECEYGPRVEMLVGLATLA